MRIAMVYAHGSPLRAPHGDISGGQQRYLRGLARELGGRGHEVTVYVRRDAPSAPLRAPFGPGATIEHIDAGPATDVPPDAVWRFHGQFAAGLRQALQLNPPDVIHTNGWQAGAAALDASDGVTPIVHSFHGLGVVERRHRSGRPTSPPERIDVERRIARAVDMVIASCVDEQREVLGLGAPRRRVEVVPSGIDIERFRHGGGGSHRTQRPRVLTLGRLLPRKGTDVAIQAMRHVPKAELVIAGGPPLADLRSDPEVTRLRACAIHHLVDDRVRFHGSVPYDEVPTLLRSADVVVATPWHEGFGTVAVEAMACGVPVVAASVGGLLDTVQHGRTGLLVPARDPAAVAAAIRYLLDNPVLRRRMGTSASAWVNEHYTWSRVADDVVSRYLEVIGHDVLQAAAT